MDPRRSAAIWLYRAAVLLALVVAPVACLGYQALCDPSVAFLPPSARAEWVKHPEQFTVPGLDGAALAEVQFSHEFDLPAAAGDVDLEIRAFGRGVLLLNGAPVWNSDDGSWKRAAVVRLHDGLRTGRNRLDLRVRNTSGFPAIQVLDPAFLRTPGGWKAALGPDFGRSRGVVPAQFRPAGAGPLQRSAAWSVLRYATPLWIALWVGLVLVGCVPRTPAAAPIPPAASGHAARTQRILTFAIILAAVGLNLANASHYPYERSLFDPHSHRDYVVRIAQTWTPPLAEDGWQMFQPPLYYYVAAAVFVLFGKDADALKAVQFVNAVAGSLLPLIAWLQLRLLRPHDVRGAWVATALVAFLPMSLYMNPLITNETFAGTSIALATFLALRLLATERPRPAQSALAGLASGAALLSKFTGMFSFATTLVCLAWTAVWRDVRPRWRVLVVFGGVTLLVAGWFYARNVVVYGKPFVGAWDTASGFAFVQEPTFRSAGFFLDVGRAFFQSPGSSLFTGFFDGHYATVWADAQQNFFSETDAAANFWLSILLLLAAAPTVVTILGLGASLAKALAAPRNVVWLAMVTIIATTCWSLLFFAVRVPTYSSIKGFYGLSLVPSFAVCFAVGRERLAAKTRWAVTLLDATALLLAALSGLVFRWH